ncbi:hypothetical protein AMAG_15254 [Allomyces macrogynus ATCC 38327]|uniref:Phosphoglycerate mutase n=1 Tax=Allomyces macrogynus (strain ATCC 38327) TaxID=578462 RepID=A0A0L0T8H7_ALLM3|nr:hypothetical protein AMAG_15254 [Allomyces macrogynus ATCC 38327]|eukprot:KNE70996.1 hypothetical protein AMAG_15254 [Allomyces macrogynus ATCC 38327]
MYSVRRQSLLAGQLPDGAVPPPSPRTPLSAVTRKSFSLAQALGTPRSNGSLASLKTIDLPGAGAQQLLSPAPVANAVQPRRNLVLNLILVRHAETDLNVRRPRVVQSNIDNPLNKKGLQQAMLLAYRLRNEKIDYIYSSPLTRCRQTAEEIARFHDKAVLYDDRLNEQNLGDLTGLSWLDAKRRLKALDRTFDEYLSDPSHKAETDDDLKERIISVYIDVVEKHVLEPNRIHYARPAGSTSQSNLLVDSYGPATPVTAVPPAPAHAPQGRLPTKECTVVLVTHGGPIKHLLSHLVEELEFATTPRPAPGSGVHHAAHVARRNKHRTTSSTSKPVSAALARRRVSTSGASAPPAPRLTQFPKNTGIYAVQLARHYDPATDEYDWSGRVARFNCVAHLAGTGWLAVAPKGTPHGVVERVPMVAKVTMAASGLAGGRVPAASVGAKDQGDGTNGGGGAVTLVKYKRAKRDLKKERAAAAAEKAAGAVGKARGAGAGQGNGGARGMMRMLGKMFTGGDATTATAAAPGAPGGPTTTGEPAGEEKRNKSLGW